MVMLISVFGTVCVLYPEIFQEQTENLRVQARICAKRLEENPELFFNQPALEDTRITLISEQGKVLYDSLEDPARMGNHAGREEIIQARRNKEGFALRASSTLDQNTCNAAIQLKDGSFLRLSRTQSSFFRFLIQAFGPMLLLIAAALVLSWWMAYTASRKIVAPINAIDPNNPKKSASYEQLSPLLDKLEENRRQILAQLEDLERKNHELALLSEHMDEGLVLVGKESSLLFANRAALSVFSLPPQIPLSKMPHPLHNLIETAAERGRASAWYSMNGRSYHLEAHRIENGTQILGVLTLILDVSEREDIQKRRREFTANVTHELKTPLQTILSASELLAGGIVSAGDIPVFAGYIHGEAKRMSKMISRILHLSRLDSQKPEKEEPVVLSSLIEQAVHDLEPTAQMHRISIVCDLSEVIVWSPPRLLEDIVLCLLENALIYNHPGGWVHVSVKESSAQALLSVADSGIGIDPAVHERIFERFYTADPSHNHQGTGLGLAIVRHALEQLEGTIQLESALNEGTRFEIRIPLKKPDMKPSGFQKEKNDSVQKEADEEPGTS